MEHTVCEDPYTPTPPVLPIDSVHFSSFFNKLFFYYYNYFRKKPEKSLLFSSFINGLDEKWAQKLPRFVEQFQVILSTL